MARDDEMARRPVTASALPASVQDVTAFSGPREFGHLSLKAQGIVAGLEILDRSRAMRCNPFPISHYRSGRREKRIAPLQAACGPVRDRRLTGLLGAVSLLALTETGAFAEESATQGRSVAQPSYDQLLEKLDRMEARIRSLESELHRKAVPDTNQGSKGRQARTNRSKAARGQQEAAHAAELAAGQQTAALESPAQGDSPSAAKLDLAPAPGFLGAAEATALEAPAQTGTDLFGVAPSPVPGLRPRKY
jgi:hypothetical protein